MQLENEKNKFFWKQINTLVFKIQVTLRSAKSFF